MALQQLFMSEPHCAVLTATTVATFPAKAAATAPDTAADAILQLASLRRRLLYLRLRLLRCLKIQTLCPTYPKHFRESVHPGKTVRSLESNDPSLGRLSLALSNVSRLALEAVKALPEKVLLTSEDLWWFLRKDFEVASTAWWNVLIFVICLEMGMMDLELYMILLLQRGRIFHSLILDSLYVMEP